MNWSSPIDRDQIASDSMLETGLREVTRLHHYEESEEDVEEIEVETPPGGPERLTSPMVPGTRLVSNAIPPLAPRFSAHLPLGLHLGVSSVPQPTESVDTTHCLLSPTNL
ncbi:hypothetical protein L1987_70850 [Smallanthus sonchifolius]|uniref:Uncharacterized protein n=1 Tax=Smallanthus sonchifolius TaxID=185202 RepID=A0ACB9ARM8_9ASTR|nr:hypothetical protein L1987_70850 [Smallanthus sonchifolius]